MPRRVTVWNSELIAISFDPSTIKSPFGRTLSTLTERVVERVVVLVVAPWPFNCCWPDVAARFASAPVGLFTPNRDVTEAFADDCRFCEVTPLATAEAESTTTTV